MILFFKIRNPVVDANAKAEFEKYLQVINDDETENYKEAVDDKLIKMFILKDFANETVSEHDWLISKGLRKDSKKIPYFIELKQSKK